MADITTGMSHAAVEKVFSETQKSKVGGELSDFEKVLSSKMDQQSEMTQKVLNLFGMSPEPKVQAVSAEGLEIKLETVTHSDIRTNGKVGDILTEVDRGAHQMNNLMEMAISGKSFSGTQLLYAQASLHQIALEIELTGKVVEQVNTGTKQLLNTSFQ